MTVVDRLLGRHPVDGEHVIAWSRCMTLAAYNQRVAQGIVHSPEYVEHMKAEQAWYDALTEAERLDAWRHP
jgi:hypothetical protein